MKFLKIFALILLLYFTCSIFAQTRVNNKYDPSLPILIKPVSHDPNFKNFPEKSFYESSENWHHIIDSVWGPGLPVAEKLNIYTTYANKIHDQFDGFNSLGINWDSLRSYYQVKINDSTSCGAFSAILSNLSLDLRDYHTRACDINVLNTPLNPGVPLLALSGFLTVEHFGAVLTVLPDNKICVLRVVNNHPLDLEPGDILLGYEGVPWNSLIDELQENELPSFGSLGGALTANYHQKLICAGMNWHLFDTIDILKYSTGDTVHLPTSLMVGLNLPQMLNNEQVTIPGVSFPGYFNNEFVSYGIINNTNIGYIYLYQEYPQSIVDQQFYEAVVALQNTDGLIIDMRLNFGGWAFFDQAFEILFNDSHLTIEDAYRCNANTFELCPSGNSNVYQITNYTPGYYDKPIAVLLGPTCVSMGDLTVQRLKYHPMIRFFGKSSAASLGDNTSINTWPAFMLTYSIGDMFHVPEPGNYLNRVEFPIDYPVWHTSNDIANGKDAVVEKALAWMDSLVFPHNILVDKYFYSSDNDSVHLSTNIENPNFHQLSARAYVKTLEGVLIDTVDLYRESLNADGENWRADFTLPATEEFYRVALTVFDETESDHFTVPNATRVTTVGSVTIDSIYVTDQSTYFFVKPFVKNNSTSKTITNALMHLNCNDSWVTSITPDIRVLPDIPPGSIVSPASMFRVDIDTSIFPDYFNFEVEVYSSGWPYWIDSMRFPPVALININPLLLDFGEVAIDSSATKTFNIINYGDEDLVISNITSSDPVFTVNLTSAVIPPDSSQEVEVTFTPTVLQTYNEAIEIIHNAAGSPDTVTVRGNGVTDVEKDLQPLTYSLKQNYPNPFNPTTMIKYSLPEVNKVRLKIYNLLGEEVATLVNEEKIAGYYQIEFNASALPSGIYFYQLRAGSFVESKKMILLK